MNHTTTCAHCGASVYRSRFVIVRHRRAQTLCLDCLLARVPFVRRAVSVTPDTERQPVVIVDADDAWFDDDDESEA